VTAGAAVASRRGASFFAKTYHGPTMTRHRLPNRRPAETFDLEVDGLRYTATIRRSASGQIFEIFLNNHRVNSAADVNARDAAIATSIALQFGADLEVIRRALCRDSHGRASGPLGAALDAVADMEG
jgi:ribonucleoside-diphosphate reductase alpha chain